MFPQNALFNKTRPVLTQHVKPVLFYMICFHIPGLEDMVQETELLDLLT